MSDPQTPVLASASPSAIARAFIAGLSSTLITDESKVVQPVLDGYLGNLLATPDAENAVAQSLSFETQIVALAPTAESVGIKDSAFALKTLVDIQLPALVAAIAAETAASLNKA